jgi:hypothetical protein
VDDLESDRSLIEEISRHLSEGPRKSMKNLDKKRAVRAKIPNGYFPNTILERSRYSKYRLPFASVV